jgi:hypothetical protein
LLPHPQPETYVLYHLPIRGQQIREKRHKQCHEATDQQDGCQDEGLHMGARLTLRKKPQIAHPKYDTGDN